MHDLIIIGGGAAGLAAAAYALDKQLAVRVIAEQLGGKSDWQRHASAAQPGPPNTGGDVVRVLRERVARCPGLTLDDSVTAVAQANGVFHVETQRHGREEARALIIATGVTPIALDVPGGKDMLGYGLGYSTATHAQELRGTVAAVIGATPRALCGVHELARIASMVYWIGPGLKELMSPLGMALQYRHNVKVFEGFRVVEVIGAQRVEALMIERAGEIQRLAVDGAFVDLGLKPNNALVGDLVKRDAAGFIQVTESGATTLPGVFAAGDVTTVFGEQLLVAVGQGARAAHSAYEYLLSHRMARDEPIARSQPAMETS
jgi:thioredoxin reductase